VKPNRLATSSAWILFSLAVAVLKAVRVRVKVMDPLSPFPLEGGRAGDGGGGLAATTAPADLE